VGPRAVLDAVVKRKISSLRRESNPRTPIVQPVAQRYKYNVNIIQYTKSDELVRLLSRQIPSTLFVDR
jgi:hypothetical protein